MLVASVNHRAISYEVAKKRKKRSDKGARIVYLVRCASRDDSK
jgi:hypothetical protein